MYEVLDCVFNCRCKYFCQTIIHQSFGPVFLHVCLERGSCCFLLWMFCITYLNPCFRHNPGVTAAGAVPNALPSCGTAVQSPVAATDVGATASSGAHLCRLPQQVCCGYPVFTYSSIQQHCSLTQSIFLFHRLVDRLHVLLLLQLRVFFRQPH